MNLSNKLSRTEKREKQQIFSIRKFNVGVASVVVAAFWMVGGSQIAAADTVDAVTPETTVEVVEAPAEEETPVADEEPAAEPVAETVVEEAPVAEETPVVEEAPVEEVAEAPAAEEAPVEEVAETPAEEATEEPKAEEKAEEATPVAETRSAAPAEEAAPVEEAPAVETRVVATTYRVQYVSEETGEVVKQQNYSAVEETTNPANEPHTFNVNVKLDVPAGYEAVSAANNAGTEFAVVNNAIAAAIVEKDSSTRTIKVAVRKDDVIATNNNDKEGYTALFAANQEGTAADGDAERDWTAAGESTVASEKTDASLYDYSGYTTTQPTSDPAIRETDLTPVAENTIFVRLFRLRDKQSANTGASNYTSEDPVTGYLLYHVGEDATYYLTRFDKDGNVVEEVALPYGETVDMVDEASDLRLKFDRTNVDERVIRVETVAASDSGAYLQALEVIIPSGNDSGTFGDTSLSGANGVANAAASVTIPVLTNQVTHYLYASSGEDVTDNYTQSLLSGGRYTTTPIEVENHRLVAVTKYDSDSGKMVTHTLPGYADKYEYEGDEISDGTLSANSQASGTVTAWGGNGYHRVSTVGSMTRHIEIADSLTGQANIWFTDDREGYDFNESIEDSKARAIRFGETTLPLDTDGDGVADSTMTPTIQQDYNTAEYDATTGLFTTYKSSYLQEQGLPNSVVSVSLVRANANGNEEPRVFSYGYSYSYYAPEVFYYYEPLVGNVVVNYYAVDESGVVIEAIATEVVDTPDSFQGTSYNTSDDNKPTTISFGGKTYQLVSVKGTNPHAETDGSAETGEVVADKTLIVNYYYEEVKGDVVVNYVDTNGNVIKLPVVDTPESSTGTGYDTTDNKPTEITTEDGKVYRLVPSLTQGNETGDVVEGTTEITYVYEEVKGDVVVNYVDTNGNVIKLPVVDTPESSTGTGYDTTDNKPTKITTEDGKVYRLVPSLTQGNENGEVVEGTTEITYVYEEVTGSVTVEYLTEDGEVLIPKADVVRDGSLNETYETTYPETITTEDGRTFRYTRVDDSFDAPSGDIEEGEKHVVYRYEEVKGDVVVNYVDTNGNVIKLPVVDTPASSTGTGYDTTDNKPTEITTEDGKVYRLVPSLTQGNETGDVVEGTTEITYVYEEVTGSVTVEYLTEDGEVLIPKADVQRDASLNETYETTYPEEIVTEDGRTFRYTRVDDAFDAPTGDVEEGEKHVVYRYEEVKGDVVVNYVDTNGNVIKLPVVDTPESSTGTGYDTTDNKPTEITTEDGKVYRLVPALTQGNENGDVVEGTTEITYVYEEVTGSVTVEYLTEDGEVLIPKADVKRDASLNETYETTYPEEIITEDGRTFRYTRVDDAFDAPTGDVEEGEKHVVYRYEEVKGDVVVNYVDTKGNVIKLPVVDTPESSTGTGYDTTDNKPETITTEDGKVYRLVPALTQGNENGDVVEGTTEITYVYEEVTGSVTVEYLTEDGEVLIPKADVVRDGSLNETYETTYPETITTEDGRTFRYTRVDDAFDAPTGDVEEGEKHVVYRYEEVKGDVVVNYVDTKGNVIKLPVVDTPESSTGTGYDTTDNKPETITTEDGKVYRLVPALTQGNENGDVVEGTTEITYVYEEVTGSVTVEYLTEDGEVLIPKADVVRDGSLNESYETTYPEEITTEDGRTFRYTRVDDAFDAPTGDVEEGEKHVVYRYEEVKGDVVVNYVDTKGNVIKLPVVDTPESSTGTGYDTTDNKPETITTEDGKVYRLVPSLTQGNENGDVVEGTTEITYVYEEVVEEPVVEQGNLEVHYHIVDADGNVIVSDAIDALVKETSDAGTAYDTTADRLPEITVNGKTYVLVADLTDGDAETGDIEAGTTKKVNYYYVEKVEEAPIQTPNTTYVDEAGNEIQPLKEGQNPNEPIDGWEIVSSTTDPETGNVTNVYRKVEIPVVEQGDVEVHYHIVDAEGNVITTDAIDAVKKGSSDAGTAYDTTADKLTEITVNGKTYILVADLTDGDSETGEVEAGVTKKVNYYYVEKVEEAPIQTPTTTYVDEAGNEIQPLKEGQNPNEPIDGWEIVSSTTDPETGNVVNVYRKVVTPAPDRPIVEAPKTEEKAPEAPKAPVAPAPAHRVPQATAPVAQAPKAQAPVYVTKEAETLPNTGEESNAATLTGFGMLLSALGLTGLRRRKED